MWEEVTVDQSQVLQRVAAIGRLGDPRSRLATEEMMVTEDRSALSSGAVKIYYYQGNGFELTLRFTYQPRRNRYLACFGLYGSTTAQAAMDLMLQQTEASMQELGISEFYGMQPKQINFPLLQEFYDLAQTDPRIVETLFATLSDVWVYKITLSQQP